MIRGMTGQASSRFSVDNFEIDMEIRSVNSRYFELRTKIPAQYSSVEIEIRKILSQKLKRGKYDLFISVKEICFDKDSSLINREVIKNYLTEIQALSEEIGLSSDVTWQDLFSLPQIFCTSVPDLDKIRTEISANFIILIDKMMPMLLQEGAATLVDIQSSLGSIKRSVLFLENIYSKVLEEYRSSLRDRVLEITNLKPDDERLTIEIELYAIRTAINEELVRLKNHILSMEILLQDEEDECSKRMDFIAQEMNREVNTIASKASSYAITEQTILMKSEIEKMREQFRNIV